MRGGRAKCRHLHKKASHRDEESLALAIPGDVRRFCPTLEGRHAGRFAFAGAVKDNMFLQGAPCERSCV